MRNFFENIACSVGPFSSINNCAMMRLDWIVLTNGTYLDPASGRLYSSCWRSTNTSRPYGNFQPGSGKSDTYFGLPEEEKGREN
jgi:hypothetical protein